MGPLDQEGKMFRENRGRQQKLFSAIAMMHQKVKEKPALKHEAQMPW